MIFGKKPTLNKVQAVASLITGISSLLVCFFAVMIISYFHYRSRIDVEVDVFSKNAQSAFRRIEAELAVDNSPAVPALASMFKEDFGLKEIAVNSEWPFYCKTDQKICVQEMGTTVFRFAKVDTLSGLVVLMASKQLTDFWQSLSFASLAWVFVSIALVSVSGMLVQRFFTRKYIVKPISKLIPKLKENNYFEAPEYFPREIAELAYELSASIRERDDAARGKVASQVAHDIRSPLAALNMIAGELSQLPEEKRVLLRSAVMRIQDISLNLLKVSMKEIPLGTGVREKALLSSLVESIVTEKRLQFRNRYGVEIVSKISKSAYGLFADIEVSEFNCLVSNIINNAVESLTRKGEIQVRVLGEDKNTVIEIKDNGRGMSEDMIAKLGRRGVTFGKAGGSGLGLFHAKVTLEKWGGSLKIVSKVGEGTSVLVYLPKVKPPEWFVSSIDFVDDLNIVILDDDDTIHRVWDRRFFKIDLNRYRSQVFHFTNVADLESWRKSRPYSNHLYLIDFELNGSSENGLRMIERLGIRNQAILVTSRFDDPEVRARCEALGVKLIPKNLAEHIPLNGHPSNVLSSLPGMLHVETVDEEVLKRPLGMSPSANRELIN
jgi:signal transduction histidine kinase